MYIIIIIIISSSSSSSNSSCTSSSSSNITSKDTQRKSGASAQGKKNKYIMSDSGFNYTDESNVGGYTRDA